MGPYHPAVAALAKCSTSPARLFRLANARFLVRVVVFGTGRKRILVIEHPEIADRRCMRGCPQAGIYVFILNDSVDVQPFLLCDQILVLLGRNPKGKRHFYWYTRKNDILTIFAEWRGIHIESGCGTRAVSMTPGLISGPSTITPVVPSHGLLESKAFLLAVSALSARRLAAAICQPPLVTKSSLYPFAYIVSKPTRNIVWRQLRKW